MGPNLSIGDVFTNAARARPHQTAVVLGDRAMTFGALDSDSNRLARHLESAGVVTGTKVATWCSTTVDAAPMFAALSKLGAVLIPVNGLLGPDEAGGVLETARPDLVVVDDGHTEGAKRWSRSHEVLEALLDSSKGASPGPLPRSAVRGGHPHVVFFTSGSTGAPKGAVVSHQANYLRSHPGALLEPRGAMVCPYPLFHMGAWTIALQQWQARDSVVLVGSADAGSICEAVARHRATRLNCIPAVWHRILDELGSGAPGPLGSLRFADTGTSATPPELLGAMEQALPDAHIRVFYGSTEAGTVASLDHGDIGRKPYSCGVPAPGVSVRTDDGGELWVRTTTLFDGYLDDPKATAEVLVDGWYRSGDLADVDTDGFLTIVGRARDVIRTGGESVSPTEVETALCELPSVADVAVIGVSDPKWGEVVCAVVVAADRSAPPSLEDLRHHCGSRLAPYKHPRRIEVVDAIPRTSATAQVQRRALAERLSRG